MPWPTLLFLAAVSLGAGVLLCRRSGKAVAAGDDRRGWRRAWDALLEAFSPEPEAAIPEPARFPGARIGRPEDAVAPDLPPPPPPQAATGAPANGQAPAGPQHMGGAQSDLLHSITSLVNRASQGDIRDVRRCIKTLATAADCLGGGVSHLGRRLAEPDKHYGAEIWEPLTTAGAQLRSGALHLGQSDAKMVTLLRTAVGELANSPRQAPHHSQLNGPV